MFLEFAPIDRAYAGHLGKPFVQLSQRDNRPRLKDYSNGELLDFLDGSSLPRAIATSSRHEDVQRNLGAQGLRDRFQTVIARGDYARGKPHPEPFLKAAERLGVEPERCVALEDSYNGVRAASGAGMMTIMVPDLLLPTREMQELCVCIVQDLHEVHSLIRSQPSH